MTKNIKEVCFIYEHRAPIKIGNSTAYIVSDYAVASGFVTDDSSDVFVSSDLMIVCDNLIPGLWWDTYDEGERYLTKLLHVIDCNHTQNIMAALKSLKEKYPEQTI